MVAALIRCFTTPVDYKKLFLSFFVWKILLYWLLVDCSLILGFKLRNQLKHVQVALPSCGVNKIRSTFPTVFSSFLHILHRVHISLRCNSDHRYPSLTVGCIAKPLFLIFSSVRYAGPLRVQSDWLPNNWLLNDQLQSFYNKCQKC